MRFALDRSMLDFAASIDSMLAAADVPAISRSRASGDVEPVRALWKSMADIGITGLLVDAEFGGMAATAMDMVVAMECIGKWAVPGPVVESIVAVPSLIDLSKHIDQRGVWLSDLASGALIATAAIEPMAPFALDPDAAQLVLLAREGTVGPATVSHVRPSIDPSRTLGVPEFADGVQPVRGAEHAIETAGILASLGCAAQLLGAGEALLDKSVAYAKARNQFGRPIGSFQAVKHALADVMIGLEMARPLVYNAALSVQSRSAHARRDVSAAKIACGAAAYRSSRAALQVHGAIGYTMEFDLSLWITKVRALQSSWGTEAVHRGRVLEAL